jgi:riboflavin synthase
MRVSTRNISGTDETCQPCGGCQRCQHYHELRDEVTRLRRMIRRMRAVMKTLVYFTGIVAHEDEGDELKLPSSVAARRTIKHAAKVWEESEKCL